ncbi:hypothetical protein IFM51744_10844 [Aspergillus udagawae]|nr:hypothetical protein IFM51744_10844 [Aspergillus udagawae]GFG20147.1 hypothetical protein IFM5058_10488 [Aspergillus udagawae]
MASQLQLHINEIPNLGLSDAIQAIIDLAPGLTASVSPTGQYVIHHHDYEGPAHLNDLASHYLECGRRCTNEHAPFRLRLLHQTLDDVFDNLYGPAYKALRAGISDGSVVLPEREEGRGCACCAGEPDALILAGFSTCEAFYFEEEEYRRLFGDQPDHGSRTSFWKDGEERRESWIMASKEQLEEAIARDSTLSSRL